MGPTAPACWYTLNSLCQGFMWVCRPFNYRYINSKIRRVIIERFSDLYHVVKICLWFFIVHVLVWTCMQLCCGVAMHWWRNTQNKIICIQLYNAVVPSNYQLLECSYLAVSSSILYLYICILHTTQVILFYCCSTWFSSFCIWQWAP